MKYPKISIVTPSYNQGKYIEATIKSVLKQNYPNVEYLIIDGGSTDESISIIQKYEDQLAYWVSEPDKGQTDALVKGFQKATGDILCWLCSDDLLEPGTLHEVAQFFQNNPQARVVYGDTKWIDAEDNLIQERKEIPFNRFIFMYEHNFIPQPSTFWRRDLYEEVGGLNPDFNMAMDSDLWMRFAEVTKIYHVRKYWSCMRLYPEHKTHRLRHTTHLEDSSIRQRYYGAEPDWIIRPKKIVAKSTRLLLKLGTGCYWRSSSSAFTFGKPNFSEK